MDRIRNNLSRIPKEWLETSGRNVKVGVCDTGFNINHKALKNAITDYRLLGGNNNKEHGTHVAGIIGSRPDDIRVTNGLAKMSKMYLAGISTNSGLGYKTLSMALEWMAEVGVDVLNLSLAYFERDKKLEALLEEIARNALIVSSYSVSLNYPHSYDYIVSVGVDDCEADVNYFGEFMSTSASNGYITMRGPSMATAFVSSVACLAKSYDKKITKKEFLSEICGEAKLDVKKNNNIIYGNRNNCLNILFD